jgi:hypothetical protein
VATVAPLNTMSSSSEPSTTLDKPPTSTAVSIVTGIYNATSAAVQLTAKVANDVVNTAYSIVEPHHDAYLAGVQAEQMEIKRIVASTTGAGIDNQSLMRANYNGVYRSYQSQGLNPTSQLIPTGPVQKMTVGAILEPEEQQEAETVDALFRAGKVQVYSPGDVNESNGAQILGPAYSQLNRQQIFGLEYTMLVQGDVNMVDFNFPPESAPLGFVTPVTFAGTALGGMLVIDRTPPAVAAESIDDTIIHELQHAADNAIAYKAFEYYQNPNLSTQEEAVVNDALYSSLYLMGQPYEESKENSNFDENLVNSNYVNTLDEVRAYSVNEANQRNLALHISQGTAHPEHDSDAHFEPIPMDEAEIIADTLINSEVLQQIDDDLNAFLDFLETRE